MNKNVKMALLLVASAFLLTACTASGTAPVSNGPGFFMGFWHGAIAPFTFFWHFFDPSVGIYEAKNDGQWYNFGFLLGVGGFSSSFFFARSR